MIWGLLGILIPTVCYLITVGYYIHIGNLPMALVFFSYSVANVGFIWSMLQ